METKPQRLESTFCSCSLYQPPDGFCWDVYCVDTPIQDDPLLSDYNVPQVIEAFVQVCRGSRDPPRPRAPPLPCMPPTRAALQAALLQAKSFRPGDIQMTMVRACV